MATKWGIASAGMIAHDFLTGLSFLSSNDHKVVAVAARDVKKAKEFATLHRIPQAYGSYRELATNPEIEIVYVGTINSTHYEVSKLMLDHGKHVLCEKAMCLNEKQTTTLIELARKKKLFLMEAIWSRCFPLYKYLKQQIQAGAIGDLLQINANMGFDLSVPRLQQKEMGGGTMLDMGVYVLQIVVLLFGSEMPTSVEAVGHLNQSGVDTNAAIILTYSKLRTAVLTTSTLVNLDNQAVIYGSKGSITLHAPFWCPTKITICNKVENTELTREFPLPPPPNRIFFTNSSALMYEAEEVRRCIKQGLVESPLLTHEESILISRLQEEVNAQLGIKFE